MHRAFAFAACAAAAAVVAGAVGTAVQTPRLPPIVMHSKAGTQRAVQESYCLSYETPEGVVSGCTDTFDLLPRRLSVIRPGERVQIWLRDARIVRRSAGCGPSGRCEATVAVSRLGCRKIIARFDLRTNRTSWRARLAPGAYELEVFVGQFATASAGGSASGSFGLLVDRNRRRDVISARGHAVCG